MTRLYSFTREILARTESKLIDVWINAIDSGTRRAIVSSVASCILMLDIVRIARKMKGGGGEYTNGLDCETGCLSHPDKIPPKNFQKFGARIYRLLYLLEHAELSDAEWDDSYRLYVRHRRKKQKIIEEEE